MTRPEPELAQLARLWGVQASYVDLDRRRRRASRESLLAVLGALGAPITSDTATTAEVAAALRDRHRRLWTRRLEPVTVAWGGRLSLELRLPAAEASGTLDVAIALEDSEARTARLDLDAGRVLDRAEIDGADHVRLEVAVAGRLPIGYHRVSVPGCSTLVIAAPRHAYFGSPGGPPGGPPGRPPHLLGVFAPLYALHSRSSLGIGDFRDLAELQEWVGSVGGQAVATLPLFATFLDEPFEPSPYSPVSRRFWNEVFIDVASVPEVGASPEAQAALAEEGARLAATVAAPLVDYRLVYAGKRRILAAAATHLYSSGGARRDELERFAAAHPDLEDYAAFRAAGETFRTPWQQWPAAARAGTLAAEEAPGARRDYHRYVQFVAEAQLNATRSGGGPGLLLDLPLGVHPAGYDVWRERGSFITGATAGAPPDPLNAKGQDWGNPPLHPEGMREGGYAYNIACLRQLMRHAATLRIDHVMGLHRLFVLPPGRDARDGVYIRYRSEENYALLSLESQRAKTLIVGEDLGTVPGACRRAMASQRVLRCYVAQWGIEEGALVLPTRDAMASINTHDMAPYAAFWEGSDIEERVGLGLLTPQQAEADRRERDRQRERLIGALMAEGLLARDVDPAGFEQAVLGAWLRFLARSDAPVVLVSLEDLWLERESQNIPGTVDEHPNWRRRMRYPLEAIRSMPSVVGTLQELGELRTRPATS